MIKIFLSLFFVITMLMATRAYTEPYPYEFTNDDVYKAVLELHKGSGGRYYVWHECQKRLDKEKREQRAREYAQAIMTSIYNVHDKTDVWIDPRHVAAIIYRESSNDECIIGQQEIKMLADRLGHQPTKAEILANIEKWKIAKSNAFKHCKYHKEYLPKVHCAKQYLIHYYPEYGPILGWDVGAAQFRYPSANLKNRIVVLPNGKKIEKITLRDLFDYKVSIQMLIEDLVKHKINCASHTHILRSKAGKKVRVLNVEEAYFVHHNTPTGWSWKYWRNINKHLSVIDKVKMHSISFRSMFTRVFSVKKKSAKT